MNVKGPRGRLTRCGRTSSLWRHQHRSDLPAIDTPTHGTVLRAADRLRRQAELLTATLSDETTTSALGASGLSELIVDGYARVLSLDVERLGLEREITRLAESGDPGMAGELRELSAVLRRVIQASGALRVCLDGLRARANGAEPG